MRSNPVADGGGPRGETQLAPELGSVMTALLPALLQKLAIRIDGGNALDWCRTASKSRNDAYRADLLHVNSGIQSC